MNRIKLVYKALFFGILILLTSCENSNKDVKKLDKSSVLAGFTVDSISDKRHGYLKEVMDAEGAIYVTVDFVDYLNGKEAQIAEWRDAAYFIENGDTISNIIDGYYISNINPKLRTFKVGSKAIIENIIEDDGSKKMVPQKLLNIEQLDKYLQAKNLLYIYIENGVILQIDEQFTP